MEWIQFVSASALVVRTGLVDESPPRQLSSSFHHVSYLPLSGSGKNMMMNTFSKGRCLKLSIGRDCGYLPQKMVASDKFDYSPANAKKGEAKRVVMGRVTTKDGSGGLGLGQLECFAQKAHYTIRYCSFCQGIVYLFGREGGVNIGTRGLVGRVGFFSHGEEGRTQVDTNVLHIFYDSCQALHEWLSKVLRNGRPQSMGTGRAEAR